MSHTLATELLTKYKFTTDFIKDNAKLKHLPLAPPTDLSLYLYGRAKQFEIGDCNVEQPSVWYITQRYKWGAWSSVRGMPKWQAFHEYMIALRDYILGLNSNSFTAEGCELKQGMLDACALNDDHVKFIHSEGSYTPQHEQEQQQDKDNENTGVAYTVDGDSSPLTGPSIIAQFPSPAIPTDYTPIPTTIPPPINPQQTPLTPLRSTQLASGSLTPVVGLSNQDATRQQQQQQQESSGFPSTPQKNTQHNYTSQSNGSSSPSSAIDDSSAAEIPFSPQSIRVGSRAARKSIHTNTNYHQTPTRNAHTAINPLYTFHTHQDGEVNNNNFSPLLSSTTTTTAAATAATTTTTTIPTARPSATAPTTKEIFLELQQHATQTQNKQLLLLLSLIDQRETSNYLKFQAYKQQQQQHLEFIDQLQQQISSNYHSQESLINTFNALCRDYNGLKQQHERVVGQVSPINTAITQQKERLDAFEVQTKSFITSFGEKLVYCVQLIDQKFPTGWRGIKKRIIYWIKWVLRFYTMYATVLALNDIRNWCIQSRWLYKNVTLPFRQYMNRK